MLGGRVESKDVIPSQELYHTAFIHSVKSMRWGEAERFIILKNELSSDARAEGKPEL